MAETRGVRNNNPGNIDYNPRNKWDGQLGIEIGVTNPRFAQFGTPQSGIRALAKLLLNYRGKDGMPGVGGTGIDTVREVINRWAPAHENNTSAYANAVAKGLGVTPSDSIDISKFDVLLGLVKGIIKHENGYMPYTDSVVDEGVRRAVR